ncbi:hypothetical protein, partial [Escherichia coli]|uniref:hypothetical protein n=1 Tax=Escherichia coli TaxID=562 RepID=UPI0028E01C6E
VPDTNPATLWDRSVSLDAIIQMAHDGAPYAQEIFVYDACRTEIRGAKGGATGPVDEPAVAGTLVMFSTASGMPAADGGPFSKILA